MYIYTHTSTYIIQSFRDLTVTCATLRLWPWHHVLVSSQGDLQSQYVSIQSAISQGRRLVCLMQLVKSCKANSNKIQLLIVDPSIDPSILVPNSSDDCVFLTRNSKWLKPNSVFTLPTRLM